MVDSPQNSVIFKTKGLIDIRSFTSFGVNSKPKTNSPIGYFGTGLKYTVAVLVRNNMKVELFVGKDKYTFYKSPAKFRDKHFDFIRMKKESWAGELMSWIKPRYDELPYTTELGKNWEMWEGFRELYTNTLDEGGEAYITGTPHDVPSDDFTFIKVTGEAFVKEYYDRDKNFLPDGLRQRTDSERIQVFERPSNHVYYRGMRVHDLKHPSTLTYNLLCDIKLTENRQAASVFELEMEIANYILASENEEQTQKILRGRETFESKINLTYGYATPSRSFTSAYRAVGATNPTALSVINSHEPRKKVQNPLDSHPRPWRQQLLGDGVVSILDARSQLVMDLIVDSNDGNKLSTEAVRYIVALMQKDLDDAEFNQWVIDRPADLSLTNTELEAEIREEGFEPATITPRDEHGYDVPF